MAISKLILNGITQMDVTQTTVDSSSLQTGYTAIGNDGELVNGSAILGGGGVTPTGTISITANNSYDITQYATADVNVPDNTLVVTISYNSTTGQWEPNKTFNELQTAYNTGKTIVVNTSSDIGSENSAEGAFYQGNTNFKYWIRSWQSGQISEAEYTYSSSGLSKTDGFYTYYDTSGATISSNSQLLNNIKAVGSDGTLYTGNIPTRTTANLSVSGPTVTVEAGYYETNVSKSIPISTATTAIIAGQAYLESNNNYAWKTTVTLPAGYYEATPLTATYSSFFPSANTQATNDKLLIGYEAYDKDGQIVTGSMPFNYFSATLQGTTTSVIIPAGYHNGQGTVSHSPLTLPSTPQSTTAGTYKSTIDRSTATRYLVIPEGYNSSTQYYTINGVANGSVNAPTATKGTVNNHSIQITPSVSYNTGYITGSTQTGIPVTVSASELVSGNLSITENGTNINVTNYATVSVDVAGGSSGSEGSSVAIDMLEGAASSTSTLIFTGLKGEPTSFYIEVDNNVTTGSPAKIAAVVFDGTSIHTQTITNTNNAQVTYDGSGVTKSYSNGTLTLTSTNASFITGESYFITYSYGGTTSSVITKDVQVGSGATSITFTGVEEEPLYWSCIFKSNFNTSSGYQRVICVGKLENNNIVGYAMDSSAHISNQYWTATYNNGSLTINSQGTNAGGYFHQPGYYQLTYVIADSSSSSGEQINVQPLNATANGTYTAPTGTAYSPVTVNVPNQASEIHVATVTWTNNSTATVSHQFTGLAGTPKAAFLRSTTTLTRSSGSTYYYIADIVWNGTLAYGNYHLRSSGNYVNVASNATPGYNVSVGTNSITFSSDATSRSTAPGSFYNGTYELTYVY